MSKTPVKIDDFRHVKMKESAKRNSRTIQDEYGVAIDNYLAGNYQEMILAESKLEEIFTERINKATDRIAAMLSGNNMDTSTILMAIMHLSSMQFNEGKDEKDMKSRNDFYQSYRKEAAAYEKAKRSK